MLKKLSLLPVLKKTHTHTQMCVHACIYTQAQALTCMQREKVRDIQREREEQRQTNKHTGRDREIEKMTERDGER